MSISLKETISRCSLGISRPTQVLPGMTSTTSILGTDNERARSLDKAVILLALTPGAGSISKRVMTGPGCTATTSTSIAKSASLISTNLDRASRASLEKPFSCGLGASSKRKAGNSASLGASNSWICFSLSIRSEISTFFITGSIRISVLPLASRTACFSLLAATTSWRCNLASSPAFFTCQISITATTRTWIQRTTYSVPIPVASITRNQEMPLNKVMPARKTANKIKVEPSKPIEPAIISLNHRPKIPPPPCGNWYSVVKKCILVKAQPMATVTKKPAQRMPISW